YQPIYCSRKSKLIATEVMMRWLSQERGTLDPGSALNQLGDHELIISLGNWIIYESCGQFRRWLDDGLMEPESWVSLDISPAHFLNPALADQIYKVLHEHQLPTHHLRLELAESILMKEAAIKQLRQLKEVGISIAIDHFGTGYSSMRYLKTNAVDSLIIDRSYVQNYLHNRESQSSTRAMVRFGQTLGKSIVAEGIDSEALAAALSELGCDYLQGAYFGTPASAEQIGN
ncbi:MAG: EAL domain-containing protein, partial [Pseudomonadales bacterium]|nr:EAL domain-containing protein [Pseudomonadales bacterium]